MSKRTPPRGASRAPAKRPANQHQSPRYGAKPSKPAARNAGQRKSPDNNRIKRGPLLLGLFILTLLAGFLYHVMKQDLPPEPTLPAALNTGTNKAAAPKPEPEPVRAVDQLQFYDILPNEKILPQRRPANTPAPKPNAQAEAPRQLWLQVGVFRQQSLADFRQQKIVSFNMPARVEAGKDAANEPVYRVLAGPFASTENHDRARRQLIEAGLDAIPINYSGVSP